MGQWGFGMGSDDNRIDGPWGSIESLDPAERLAAFNWWYGFGCGGCSGAVISTILILVGAIVGGFNA